jgi:hypothetical protein
MKDIYKIVTLISLTLYSFQSFSQKQKNDPREVEEIKLIMNDIFNNKIYTPTFYYKGVTYKLPSYFTSYKDFIINLKQRSLWNDFVVSKYLNLNKKDCYILNYVFLNDTSKLYIQKDWFSGVNVKILSDSVTKFQNNSYTNYIKPIFFRNNTR